MALNEDLNKAKQSAEEFREEISFLQDAFANIGEQIKFALDDAIDRAKGLDAVGERVQKSFGNDLVNGLKKVVTSLDKQVSLQNKINEGADIAKELTKEKQRISEVETAVRQRIAILARNDVELEKNLTAELNKQLSIQHEILDSLESQNTTQQKGLGITGKLAKGFDGILKKIDKTGTLSSILDIEGAIKATNKASSRFEKITGKPLSSIGKLRLLFSNIGKNFLSNLKGIDFVSLGLKELYSALLSVDKQTGELAKNFGISYDAALGIKSELTSAANQSYLLNVTSKGLVESFITLNNLFGTFAQINEQALEDFTRLTKEAFLSNEAASALFKTTVLTGKELEESTVEFAGQAQALAMQNGLALNQKQLLEAVKDISTATLLQLQGQPEALAEAVVNAKALGISLDKVEQIASSLLQFESSISAELEAELLTGKQLTLERARQAALSGDVATVAEEIAKQVGNAADFAKMNVIQQEALAKSVGMTRDDLAKSLMEREALVKLSGEEGETAQERFNNLVKEVGLEEAKKQLGDEQLANLYSQQNVQERFAAATEKLKDIFVAIAEPILKIVSPFVDLATTILPLVNTALYPILGVIRFIGESVTFVIEGIKSTFSLVKEMISPFIDLNGIIATIQERFTNFKEENKVLFGIIGAIGDALKGFLGTFILLIGAVKTYKAIQKSSFLLDIGKMVAKGITAAFSMPPPLGFVLGTAAIGGMAALGASLYNKFIKGDDVVSPGYGKRTLLMDEGAIALNDKDTVIAGTKLFEGNDVISPGTTETNISETNPPETNISETNISETNISETNLPETNISKTNISETNIIENKKTLPPSPTQPPTPTIDMSPVVDRLIAVENVLKQILTKEGDVYMDGNKVGKSLALANSNIGV